MKQTVRHSLSDSGFTLVELAIVLVIVGLLLGGAIAMLKPYAEMAQRNTTVEKQKRIAELLSEYALNYGRLPCPAALSPAVEPYGSPRNSGSAVDQHGNVCAAPYTAASHIGIVPFRALGLTEENVRDSWGRLMTYAVSPAMAQSSAGAISVHDRCRSEIWIPSGVNLNRNKARLCCAPYIASGGANTDIAVLDGLAGNSVFGAVHTNDAGYYGGVDAVDPSNPADVRYTQNQFIAFVLVSHGKNGDGAFIGQGAGTMPVTAPVGAQESENRNGNLVFVDRPLSMIANNNYFDDLVLWRSNTGLVGEMGRNTCARP